MAKWTGRLRQLIPGPPEVSQNSTSNDNTTSHEDNEGWKYLNRVRNKLDKLVEDFAKGRVNRGQFEELYSHYQSERSAVERLIASEPTSDAWRMAVTEGQSINIRRRLAARVLGYAVYTNADEVPLRVYGEFATLDERWISPMLAKVQNNKLFAVGRFNTGSEEANFLCTVSGQFTTLLVLFSTEPARVQMQSLEDLHSHFEQANHRFLSRWSTGQFDVDDLVFPYAAAFE
jgi:hypothetical protein